MEQLIPAPSIRKFQTAEAIQDWLASQIAQRLDIEPDDLDIQASFESYDLDSAEALVLVSKLEKCLGVPLSPTLLWNYPTIETLAQRLAEDADVFGSTS